MNIALTVDDLDLAGQIGQLLCPTLVGGELGDRPLDLGRALRDLETYGWGGYIAFHVTSDVLAPALNQLQAASRVPLLVAADMEHGAGQQVPGLTAFPTAMAFGAADDVGLTALAGAWTAREAHGVGLNWILAPVADVAVNPANPIIGPRAYAGLPDRAARHAAAFVGGVQGQGALACAKHFPGHGDTAVDSHTQLGTVGGSHDQLQAVAWPPFAAAIAAHVATVMGAHLAVPALDDAATPATLSRRLMTGVLRDELGFGGLVVTDAMLMGGVGAFDPGEAAVAAIAAGCDMLLMPRDPAGAHAALLAAVHDRRLATERVREAVGRVLAAKARLGPPPEVGPAIAAAEVAHRVAAGAMTLARGPLPPGRPHAVAFDDGAAPASLAAWDAALQAHGHGPGDVVTPETSDDAFAAVLARAAAADAVLVGLFSPVRIGKGRGLLGPRLAARLDALAAARPTTALALGSPYMVCQAPAAQAWVLAYGAHPTQVEAALAAVLGGAGFPGSLPVVLPDALGPAANEARGGGAFTD